MNQPRVAWQRMSWKERAPLLRRVPELESRLPEYISQRRWFAGKAREIRGLTCWDLAVLSNEHQALLLTLAQVQYADSGSELYFVPLASPPLELVLGSKSGWGEWIVANGRTPALTIVEACGDQNFGRRVLGEIIRNLDVASVRKGVFRFRAIPGARPEEADDLPVHLLGAEQSNTSLVIGERLLLKTIRRLAPGPNPDLEVTRFLTERTGFRHIAPMYGYVEYAGPNGVYSIALLQKYVPNQGDCWEYTLRLLGQLYDTAAPRQKAGLQGVDDVLLPCLESCLELSKQLGELTAELHVALASDSSDPAFAPEPCSLLDGALRVRRAISLADSTLTELAGSPQTCPPPLYHEVVKLRGRRSELSARLAQLPALQIGVLQTRLHADYHLGQVLRSDEGLVVIDFEGEPGREPEERSAKGSPMADVAGMLRSFSYARAMALGGVDDELRPAINSGVGSQWEGMMRRRFLDAYFSGVAGQPFVPNSDEQARQLVALFELDKAIYELAYELRHRPEWLSIPLGYLAKTLE